MTETARHLFAQLEHQENAYEAWLAGESHPDDAIYEAIWAGETPGVSEESARGRLRRDTAVLKQLESGELDYTDIIGWQALGNTRQMVQHSLLNRIALYEEALRCSGRNLSMTQKRVKDIRRGD